MQYYELSQVRKIKYFFYKNNLEIYIYIIKKYLQYYISSPRLWLSETEHRKAELTRECHLHALLPDTRHPNHRAAHNHKFTWHRLEVRTQVKLAQLIIWQWLINDMHCIMIPFPRPGKKVRRNVYQFSIILSINSQEMAQCVHQRSNSLMLRNTLIAQHKSLYTAHKFMCSSHVNSQLTS